MKLPYIVGPSVRQPLDFFGRSGQARQFFEMLDGPQTQCVSVLGLRRAGKTSFLQHVAHPTVLAAHLPDAARYVLIYIDLSACQNAAQFYGRVCRRLLSVLSSRGVARDAGPAAADVYAVESLLYDVGERRVVLLMDEFDHLRVADFGGEFLTELRALAGVWDYELAYVTASYWDLYRLGNFVGLPPTSPFYNIFYPTPIYLSGLSPAELDDLIRVPARRVGIDASDEDIAVIRHIAGSLPFFVQVTAAVWLSHKVDGRTPAPADVTPRLVSEMGPYFEQWWGHFSDVERGVLLAVARERPVARLPYEGDEIDSAVARLRNYGVLAATGNHLWADSLLFNEWLCRAARNRSPA
jgi:hypothetical protein